MKKNSEADQKSLFSRPLLLLDFITYAGYSTRVNAPL